MLAPLAAGALAGEEERGEDCRALYVSNCVYKIRRKAFDKAGCWLRDALATLLAQLKSGFLAYHFFFELLTGKNGQGVSASGNRCRSSRGQDEVGQLKIVVEIGDGEGAVWGMGARLQLVVPELRPHSPNAHQQNAAAAVRHFPGLEPQPSTVGTTLKLINPEKLMGIIWREKAE